MARVSIRPADLRLPRHKPYDGSSSGYREWCALYGCRLCECGEHNGHGGALDSWKLVHFIRHCAPHPCGTLKWSVTIQGRRARRRTENNFLNGATRRPSESKEHNPNERPDASCSFPEDCVKIRWISILLLLALAQAQFSPTRQSARSHGRKNELDRWW